MSKTTIIKTVKSKKTTNKRRNEKDVRYHNMASLINNGVITSFSEIIKYKYITPTILARDLKINYTTFYFKDKAANFNDTYFAYNFKLSTILKLSKLFEVSPDTILKLVLADNTSELTKSSNEGEKNKKSTKQVNKKVLK
ncbi:MAG: hypothetical protein WBP45_14865 [Daejeonella sp.]